jgi:ribonuclease Z
MMHAICRREEPVPPNRSEPLHIYGPLGLRHMIASIIGATQPRFYLKYYVHELLLPEESADNASSPKLKLSKSVRREGETYIKYDNRTNSWNICEDSTIIIRAGKLRHKVPCWGYVFEEKPTPGTLNAERCMELGLRPGPLYGALKRGESVTLPSGKILTPEEVVEPPLEGRKVVILGDTCDSSGIAHLAQGADVLVHECTLSEKMASVAITRGHSTPRMAGLFARSIGARQLVLTHFSRRFSGADNEEEQVPHLVRKAAIAFGGPTLAAADFMTLAVPKRYPPRDERRKQQKNDLNPNYDYNNNNLSQPSRIVAQEGFPNWGDFLPSASAQMVGYNNTEEEKEEWTNQRHITKGPDQYQAQYNQGKAPNEEKDNNKKNKKKKEKKATESGTQTNTNKNTEKQEKGPKGPLIELVNTFHRLWGNKKE